MRTLLIKLSFSKMDLLKKNLHFINMFPKEAWINPVQGFSWRFWGTIQNTSNTFFIFFPEQYNKITIANLEITV